MKYFLLALMFLSVPAGARAQEAPHIIFPKATLDALAKEPPLTLKDFDTYLLVMSKMVELTLGSGPMGPAELYTIQKQAGWSELRALLVLTKLAYAKELPMNEHIDELAKFVNEVPEYVIPSVLRPTWADLMLIKNNLPALQNNIDQIQARCAPSGD